MIGVQLLSQLTCEMNQISEVDANRSLTKHRKIASSFRDTQLFVIFRLSCTLLGNARVNCKSLNFNNESQHGLMTQLLRLAQNCLTFDFIGERFVLFLLRFCCQKKDRFWLKTRF